MVVEIPVHFATLAEVGYVGCAHPRAEEDPLALNRLRCLDCGAQAFALGTSLVWRGSSLTFERRPLQIWEDDVVEEE